MSFLVGVVEELPGECLEELPGEGVKELSGEVLGGLLGEGLKSFPVRSSANFSERVLARGGWSHPEEAVGGSLV